MFTFLESRWTVISILSLLALLVALLVAPSMAGALTITVLLISLGMAIVFIIRRQLKRSFGQD